MVHIQDYSISLIEENTIKQGMARSFYSQHGYAVLQKAQEYGDVFTLPEFLQTLYLSSFQGSLTEVPFTLQTEEIIGKSKAGSPVAVVVHGSGLLTPKRIRNGIILEEIVEYEVPDHGLTRTKSGRGQFALPLYDAEIDALLEGHILPIFQYADFKSGISNLPREYAIVRDFCSEKEFPTDKYFARDYYLSMLKEVPRIISLAGGVENLENCFDLLNLHCGLQEMRYSHSLHDIDPEQAQGRFVEVHGINNLFYSFMGMDGPARFLAVKRENLQEKIDKEIMIEVP